MNPSPWYVYPFLLFPNEIMSNLEKRVQTGLTSSPPNAWQLSLGVMRMWHRSIFRSETVGTCADGKARNTWRARLLHNRALRLPCLLLEGAVAPLDMTGLASPKERIIRHLLGAHHDGNQFVFDFELLAAHPGALEELRDQTRAILQANDARSRWMRDLTVFEHYHENLLAAVERAIVEGIVLSDAERLNADLTLAGYLQWCSQQPSTPSATWTAWREGALDFSSAAGARA